MPRERNPRTTAVSSRVLEAITSSRTRIRIAELISSRPRGLRELARVTRLSVPGVLRHIDELNKVGVIKEERVSSKRLPVRKMYSLKGIRVVDFSLGDLFITELTAERDYEAAGGSSLEELASDIILARRRIKEKARKLSSAIGNLLEDESRLLGSIDALNLGDDDRLIVLTAYTEETLEEAARVLEDQGLAEARRSIETAMSKARRLVSK